MNILAACADKNLFQQWFRDRTTWNAWFAFLAALFALEMTDEQFAIFKKHTGRTKRPNTPFREAWLICGRRAGKSFMMALIAVYLAAFHNYRRYLAPGERATVMIIAADRKQARVIVRYIKAMLHAIPMLKRMLQRETTESFDLNNFTTIEVGTASFKSTRGYTYAAVLADEIAFWPTDDAAEPDYAILDAIRPGMATIPTAMLICASSPYARRGALYDAHKRYFGHDDAPALVWQAATREMNPSVPQSLIDEAISRDPAAARAEYLAQFRDDVAQLLPRDIVDGTVIPGLRERGPVPGVQYVAFTDVSGGASDAYTLAIAHKEGAAAVLDYIGIVPPPFSPDAVTADYCTVLKQYGVRTVTGDRYAGHWPRERFAVHGVTYQVAELNRSEIYAATVPLFMGGNVELLDNEMLVDQFVNLERRTGRSGRDIIDHAPNAHDDAANAAAGAMVLATQKRKGYTIEDLKRAVA